jgi:hypothetical protein
MQENKQQVVMRLAGKLIEGFPLAQDFVNALTDAYDAGVKAQAQYRESQYQEIIAKSEEREAELRRLRAEVEAIRAKETIQ